MVNLAYVKSQLDYSYETGKFTWKVDGKGRKRGHEAGCLSNQTGYVLIGLKGRLYLAHRLAWWHFYEEEPGRYLDHIDRNRSNNSIINLRQVTHQQNMANSTARSTSSSGIKGVSWCSSTKKWRATITVDGKQRSLGRHKNLDDAAKAYADASIKEHGEYAAANGEKFQQREAHAE